MKILYVGDVMGEMGLKTLEEVLPGLVKEKQVDLVVAQAENVSGGKGLTVADFERLKKTGVQVFTGGNWTLFRPETTTLLDDELIPVTRPANYPADTPGKRFKYVDTPKGKILIVSLLGKIVGKDADVPVDNPLKVIDEILESEKEISKTATIVNFHGDFSSEKVVAGYYLDGRVTAVIGDHWHVPTADAQLLPKGTAHVTDVGMCGSLDSSLGIRFDSVIPRWRNGIKTTNELETSGRRQFNAVLIESNDSGLASSIEPVRKVL